MGWRADIIIESSLPIQQTENEVVISLVAAVHKKEVGLKPNSFTYLVLHFRLFTL